MKVIKRDGSVAPYQTEKISIAISGAFNELGKEFFDDTVIADVENIIYETYNDVVGIEDIQDIVEDVLIEHGYITEAKAYIRYRYKRELTRHARNEAEILRMIQGDDEYWTTENSNKDVRLANTQRDYIAGIIDTDLARNFIFPKESVKAHDEGIIHIHDMDFSAERTYTNCCLVNLEDMLQNGTMINGIKIEKPHRLITATTIATQIIAAVSGAQYGGQTVTLTHLAPFVRDSWNRHYNDAREETKSLVGELFDYQIETLCKNIADKRIKKEIEDAVQTFNFQINSFCLSRGQTPFLTVFMYLGETEEYKEEVALLIEEFFKQRIRGMKNRKGQYITVAFPKLVYVLEEDNIYPDSPYWYLTELATECTTKRMVPDYVSEKKLKEMKIAPNGEHCCYGPMGCRSFLTPTYVNPLTGQAEFYGRGNIGVCTINLADAALSAVDYAKRNNWVTNNSDDCQKDGYSQKALEEVFWDLMEKRTELCYDVQKVRFDRLIETPAEVNPILWCDGALARLNPEDKIGQVLINKRFTSSLGYAGLYECALAITGESHTSPRGKEFAMRVMQFLNDKCTEWKMRDPIDYSLYATPIENTTYKFAKNLRRRFGEIEGITDRDFITNSYHVFVEEPINPFAKIDIESEFQVLSPGGMISYIESCNLSNNPQVIYSLLQYIYNKTGYCEINTKLDNCEICNFAGEIILREDENGHHYFECPNCGNTDFNKMNIARRVCGYISTSPMSEGRLDEIINRYVHVNDIELEE